MRCASCGSENPDSKRFCGDCGSPLGSGCPKCGAENPADKKFCGDCGADLFQPTAAPQSAESAAARVVSERIESHEVPAGERRHLTVLVVANLIYESFVGGHFNASAAMLRSTSATA